MGHKSLKMFFEVYARWIDRADKGLEKARMDAVTVAKASPRRAAQQLITKRPRLVARDA
jgi:hypothetical protein